MQSKDKVNLSAGIGVALRETNMESGAADYILFVNSKAVGLIEAKAEDLGYKLLQVEEQSARYSTDTIKIGKFTIENEKPFVYESRTRLRTRQRIAGKDKKEEKEIDMNQEIRKFLIDQCVKGQPVYYEDVAQRLKLDLSLPAHRDILSKELGDISAFEHENGRPLISAAAIYKTTNDHGPGFYKISEALGFGKASKLAANNFGIEEFNKSQKFWQNTDNYDAFIDVEVNPTTVNEIDFFTELDLRYFAEVAGSSYLSKDENSEIKKKRLKNLGDKIKYLLKISMPNGFIHDKVNWQQHERVFKHFWTRIFKPSPANKYIFFVLGVNINGEFFVKLDFSRMKGATFDLLPENLINDYESVIKKVSPGYQELTISAADIGNFDYDTLSELVSDYFNRYLGLYSILIDELSGSGNGTTSDIQEREEGTISDSEVPLNIISRVPKKYNFDTGKNIDWEKQNRQYQRIGSLGEQLVLKLEKEKVAKRFGDKKANEVIKQPDGKGYDIRSFNDNGDEMHIEVKTTTSGKNTPFYLTRAEVSFYETQPSNYYLYRLHNYNVKLNCADRFIMSANDLKHFTLTPLTYELSSDAE